MVDQTLDKARELASEIPPNREMPLVITKIDEAKMWLERAQRVERQTPQRNTAPRR
jgi:hypothetical protein